MDVASVLSKSKQMTDIGHTRNPYKGFCTGILSTAAHDPYSQFLMQTIYKKQRITCIGKRKEIMPINLITYVKGLKSHSWDSHDTSFDQIGTTP